MELEPYASRCVRQGEVHELVTTDHTQTAPGTRIDRVLGFAEIAHAGVIDRGDELWVNGHRIGTVLSFDACHFPNHYNVLITADTPRTGLDLALAPEATIRFEPTAPTLQDLSEKPDHSPVLSPTVALLILSVWECSSAVPSMC